MKYYAHFSINYYRGFATDGEDLYKVEKGTVRIIEPTEHYHRYEINRLLKEGNQFDNMEVALNFLTESYHNSQVDRLVRASNYVDKSKEVFDQIQKDWESIKDDLNPIPATVDNIRIVLRHLNSLNWGLWQLPNLGINYSANQYDCDGKQATTIKLDEPVSDPERGIENQTMFQTGAPRGYLVNYQRL